MLALSLPRLGLVCLFFGTAWCLASSGNTDADAVDSSNFDWGAEVPDVAVGVNVGEDEQDSHAQGRCPFRSNWRCLCPRDHWQTVLERASRVQLGCRSTAAALFFEGAVQRARPRRGQILRPNNALRLQQPMITITVRPLSQT